MLAMYESDELLLAVSVGVMLRWAEVETLEEPDPLLHAITQQLQLDGETGAMP